MKARTALLALSFLLTPAFGATDYNCMNTCTAAGYQYGLCQAKCSYDSNPQQPMPQPPRQTDYQCVQQCTANGNMYQYCVQRCSY